MTTAKSTKPLEVEKRRLHSEADAEIGRISDRLLYGMLWRFLRPYASQLVVVAVLLLATSGLTVLLPLIIQRAVDGPITAGQLAGLIPLGLAYFGLIAIIFGLRFGYIYLLQTVGQSALRSLRGEMMAHILRQDMRFFNTTPVGQLVSRMSNDVDNLTELISTSFVMVATNLVTLAAIVITMFALNWRLALLALAVMPVMVGATIYFRRKLRASSRAFHRLIAEYLAYLNEQFNGMLIVQLFGRQAASRREFDRINRSHVAIHSNWRDQYTAYASILQFMTSVGLALLVYGGGQGVLAGWASLGMLIAFCDYARRSYEPMMMLSEQIAQIQTALSAGERIARLLKVEPQIQSPAEPVRLHERPRTFAFDHVEFGYDSDHPVLRDITFEVKAGQRVAVVGATGAGKTSLAGLLTRFYDVQRGRVLINGVDVRRFNLDDLRRYVTVVPQSPYCFDGTIADNLRLFDPSISFERMREAAQIARAADFIEKLPGGYDFRLLPGGANLSQGQRQLLALARALLHSPDSILVLDEATSSIDTATEALIQQGLNQILRGRTSLIIAHRLSTVREADRILVMKRGQIVEDGRHDELLAREGLYTALYRRQFAGVYADASLYRAGAAD